MQIHPLADVHTSNIGSGTTIWQFVVILSDAVIGANCNINCRVFIENDVIIGNNVTVKTGVSIWDAIRIGDDVFIGPSVVFVTDRYPRSRQKVNYPFTYIKKGASVGANSTILHGITVGEYAMVGAASLVTKDVPNYALVYGSPAVWHGWVDEKGQKLSKGADGTWVSPDGAVFTESGTAIVRF